ncbi:MAG TPA: class I SAM-dependent methyltransferase [Pyrinomonadaceae bacterium]|nr:class I SAM-dependent methyltransferase [Pyrinomonadaceae bacterium]
MAQAVESRKTEAGFARLASCWVCDSSELSPIHEGRFEFTEYATQDPPLAEYTGHTFRLMRCEACGFSQPDVLPTLPNYFDRMYDQHWSPEWIEQEFTARYKDDIFADVLRGLSTRLPISNRRLLDIGAHVGRFIHIAHEHGWQSEGVELNPRTSAYAQKKTGLPVHQVNAQQLAAEGHTYSAITMLDVLEHIPDPVKLLGELRNLLDEDGWLVVKVPCGPNQLMKENLRSRLKPGYRVSVADNLVHINHFSPRSLRQALLRAGFTNIDMTIGMPELAPVNGSLRSALSKAFRLGVYHAGRLIPGGIRSPLALNLQAYAQKEGSSSR